VPATAWVVIEVHVRVEVLAREVFVCPAADVLGVVEEVGDPRCVADERRKLIRPK
jgi:hypothetical protein